MSKWTPHDTIWLEPECCADPETGSLWCHDKVWPDNSDWCAECNKKPEQPTKYLLATPQREAATALYEALSLGAEMRIAQAFYFRERAQDLLIAAKLAEAVFDKALRDALDAAEGKQ